MTDTVSDVLRIQGEKLKALRLARLLTREELAERAGLDESHVGVIERGEVAGSRVKTVRMLARALEVSPDEFLDPQHSPDSRGETS